MLIANIYKQKQKTNKQIQRSPHCFAVLTVMNFWGRHALDSLAMISLGLYGRRWYAL